MNSYRPDIDGLRAVAVLMVLMFHAGLSFPGGYVGVDVFFVISGFLITGIIRKGLDAGTFSMSEFWRRRISRIAPAATITTIACVLLGLALLVPEDLAELASSAVYQQVMASNVYFSNRLDYFDGPAELKPLLHMWSLAVEEQFYLVFPFVLMLLHRMGRRFAIASIVTIGCISLAYAILLLPRNPTDAFFLLPTRVWELLLGAILHWIPVAKSSRWLLRESMAIVGLSGIVVPSLVYSSATPFPGLAAVPPCFGTALIILAGRNGQGGVFRLLSTPPLVFVGLMSFSLYLVHWPMLAYLRIRMGLELPLELRWLVVFASLIVAAASWWLVERPLRRIGTSQPKRRVFATFAVVTIGCIGVFAAIRFMDGLPGRFSEAAQRVLKDTRLYPIGSVFVEYSEVERGELPRFGYCDQKVDLVLWGDSHAAANVAAVEELARSLDLCCVVASRIATPPISGVWRPGERLEYERWNASVIEYIRRVRPSVVVLACRWSISVEGGSVVHPVISDAFTTSSSPADAERVLTEGLQRTIRQILDAGASVIILEQAPEQRMSGPQLLAGEIEYGYRSLRVTTLREHDDRQRRVRRALSSVDGWERVLRIDPFDQLFSPADPESRTKLGTVDGSYYSDDDHLSDYGSVEVVLPALIEAVRKLRSDQRISQDE